MAEQIRKKKISPVELVEAHLTQIDKLNPKMNAFVQVDAERALQAAHDAETSVMQKSPLGPLHGVPISIKSSVAVAGMRCESGTRLRAGFVPAQDAPLVARLRAAGAIVLGVTNAPELLMAWETDNLLYGRTNNPWDLERTSGGSSGGEAAAIAAGMSAGGVGSDGGGSIRVPAHFCGICGLKPTPGRIPSTGHYPVSAGTVCIDRRRRPNGAHGRRLETAVRSDARAGHGRYLCSAGSGALARRRGNQETENRLF